MKFEPHIVQIMVIIHCKFYANWSTSSYVFALSKFVRFFFAIVKRMDRQTDGWTDRRTDSQIDRQRNRHAEGQTDIQTDRQTDRQMN